MSVCHSIGLLIRAFFRNRAELAVENLALRQQLAILNEKTKRPKLRVRPVYSVLVTDKVFTALPLVALLRTLVANQQPGRPMK